jgi:hypothetical protein
MAGRSASDAADQPERDEKFVRAGRSEAATADDHQVNKIRRYFGGRPEVFEVGSK